MEMVYAISRERVFFVVETHKDNIESIDQIHSENRGNRGNFPSRYDGECRDHESDKHGARFTEKHLGFYVVEPTDED